jgi:hypothetical protein
LSGTCRREWSAISLSDESRDFERRVASEHFRVQISTSLYRAQPHFEDFKGPRPNMGVRPKTPEKESQIKRLRFSLRPEFICNFHAASKYGRRVEDRLLCDTNNCPELQPAQKSQSSAMQNRSLHFRESKKSLSSLLCLKRHSTLES